MAHSRVRGLFCACLSRSKLTSCRIVDLHSHLGEHPSPALKGADDGDSAKGPIVPWLRIVDSLNTHDLGDYLLEMFGKAQLTTVSITGYESAISGGVTTSLVLPGSLNAIGRCAMHACINCNH